MPLAIVYNFYTKNTSTLRDKIEFDSIKNLQFSCIYNLKL
jgi:hypothetical protein